MIKKFSVLLLLLLSATAHGEPRKNPVPFDEWTAEQTAALAASLRDYGLWRWEHDVTTFPEHMPKIGEPYDPVTGNVIIDLKQSKEK
jgi:hypothetical protein